MEWIGRCDPKPLIVIDSFISLHKGDENDAVMVRQHMQLYRGLVAMGCGVIVIHHIGKGETSRNYRGSSDLPAAVDVAFKLEKIGDGALLKDL